MSGENSELIAVVEEDFEIPNETSEDISVFDLETFQKQLSRLDGKKQKTPTLFSNTLNTPGPSTEIELVGDDLNKKEQNIDCECQPNVTGGAVPAVCSFSETENSHDILQDTSINNIISDEIKIQQSIVVEQPEEHKKESVKITKLKKSSISPPVRLTNKSAADSSKVGNKSNINQAKSSNRPGANVKQLSVTDTQKSVRRTVPERQNNQSRKPFLNSKNEVSTKEKGELNKRPSMIPKLSRPSTSAGNKSCSSVRSKLPIANKSITNLNNEPSDISIKMLDLKERVKMTTTLLRKKIKSSTKDDENVNLKVRKSISSEQTKTPQEELHETVIHLQRVALNITKEGKTQSEKYVTQLLAKVHEIEEISKQMFKEQTEVSESSVDDLNKETVIENKTKKKKDNRIHIKFMPSSHINDKKLKRDDPIVDNSEPDSSISVPETERHHFASTPDKINSENKIQETDSMDGVFIPSLEPPKNIEDEDESNGLDITITFPECSPTLCTTADSHLSVKVSDISEEALRKLKRCPKDFTLRMDFVQGKVVFQSGKAPENNFLMGPDLKFIENPVTNQKSDVIEIKPSTECRFSSQVIPVEHIKNRSSTKSLKSTDSELFKVVKLPFIYKNPSMSTVTKSCITFQNDNILSMAIIARHVFKSMPHITSFTNLFDDRFPNLHHSVLRSTEKKRKNRPSPKKALASSTAM